MISCRTGEGRAYGDGATLDLGQAHAADHVVHGERAGEVVLVREHEERHAGEVRYREERVQLRRRCRQALLLLVSLEITKLDSRLQSPQHSWRQLDPFPKEPTQSHSYRGSSGPTSHGTWAGPACQFMRKSRNSQQHPRSSS